MVTKINAFTLPKENLVSSIGKKTAPPQPEKKWSSWQ